MIATPTVVEDAPVVPAQKVVAAGGCESFKPLVEAYNWNVNIAMAIMKAESGCNPNSDNTGLNRDGSNDKGLFQINSCHFDLIGDQERFNPEANVKAAYAIYSGSGWRAWATYNSNKYLKFL